MASYATEFVLGDKADKACDAKAIHTTIAAMSAEVVIPPKKNRNESFGYDPELDKERLLVECLFDKLKLDRRCFLRFDKLAR